METFFSIIIKICSVQRWMDSSSVVIIKQSEKLMILNTQLYFIQILVPPAEIIFSQAPYNNFTTIGFFPVYTFWEQNSFRSLPPPRRIHRGNFAKPNCYASCGANLVALNPVGDTFLNCFSVWIRLAELKMAAAIEFSYQRG